jgi:tetratricopeptide (TPR) repeat protein
VFKVFKLEGQNWVAGRDSRATVFIDVPEFSRQHFEIKYDDGNFMVRDLNSSNGTILNREVLSPMQWYRLVSGDQLEIVQFKLQFEIRDPQFKEKIDSMLAVEEAESSYHDHSVDHPIASNPALLPSKGAMQPALTQLRLPRARKGAKLLQNQNLNKALLALPLLLVLYFVFSEDKPQKGRADSASSTGQSKSAFETLSPEQQKFVHNSYVLAEQLFKERKYQLAKQEVTKIHQLIPYYFESKNLEKLTEVALLTELEQQKALAQEQERQQIENKIIEQTQMCGQKLVPTVTMTDLEKCLQDVVALNPEHPKIIELKLKVEQLMAAQAVKEERAQAYQERVDRQKALFHKAEVLFIETQYLSAIRAYDAVVNSNLPDPENFKTRAKRKIASIQEDLVKRQRKLEREADEFARNNKLKEAIIRLQSAVETNPNNEILKSKMTQLRGDLKKQMQALYQEGILEESVGEVESAKKKWMMILDRSLPDEEYFRKAQLKLRKYGL